MHRVVMEGCLSVLAEMQEEYLPVHTNYFNDPEVNRFILSRPPFTISQQREWLYQRRSQGDQIFAVLARELIGKVENLIFIGVMDLREIDFKKSIAYSGSVIGNKHYWGRGIAREARLMQLKIAFDELELEWVYSKTIRPNIRGQHLLESTGYQLVNVFSENRLLEGVLYDELLYRVSREIWLPLWNRYCETKKGR